MAAEDIQQMLNKQSKERVVNALWNLKQFYIDGLPQGEELLRAQHDDKSHSLYRRAESYFNDISHTFSMLLAQNMLTTDEEKAKAKEIIAFAKEVEGRVSFKEGKFATDEDVQKAKAYLTPFLEKFRK